MSRAYFRKLAFVGIIFSLCGAFVIGVDAQSRKERERSNDLVKEAVQLINRKDFTGAVEKLKLALESNPNNDEALFHKGRAHYFLNEYDAAVADLDQALKKGYKAGEVYKVRYSAYEKQKMFDLALADLGHLLKQDGSNVQYLNAAADLNYNRGNYQEAVNAYEKIISRNPNFADNYYWLARAKSKLGDTEGQAAAAQEAINRNTQFLADSLLLLASARYAQKRIPEAIDAYSRALASRPDKLETYRLLAELYRTQNRIDDAIKTLEEARRLNATNGEVYKDLSMFYSLAGRTDAAIESGRSAAQLLPNDAVAHANLCRAYYQGGKLELATGACNTALKHAPEDGEVLFFLGRLNTDLNRSAEGEKFYRRAVTTLLDATAKKPNDADAFYMLGNVYADLRQNTKAVEAYNRVLELNPKFPRTYYNIGIIRILEKDKPGAMQQYNALLELDKRLAGQLKEQIDKL